MQPSDLDQFIEEAKYGKRLYLYFTGAIVLSGVVLASASFLLPLPDKAAIPELTKLGGGFIACLSAFPIKEFLAKRERVVALTAIRQRISLASTQQIQSNELTKLVEIYWKIYEKGRRVADQGPVFGDVNQFAALVAQRERRRLIFLAFGIGISSLFALALIYLAVTSVAKAQREVTAAQQQVDVLEERRRGLENEIAVKTAQLESISSRLQSATTPQQRTEVVQAVAEQVAQGSRLVYLQFRGALSRDTMRGLQAQLQENRFSAPGIERVAKSYDNEVRYFRPEDAENARKVAAIAAQYFTQKCPPPPPRTFPVKLTPAPNQPPPPQIEIWVSMNCGE